MRRQLRVGHPYGGATPARGAGELQRAGRCIGEERQRHGGDDRDGGNFEQEAPQIQVMHRQNGSRLA